MFYNMIFVNASLIIVHIQKSSMNAAQILKKINVQ